MQRYVVFILLITTCTFSQTRNIINAVSSATVGQRQVNLLHVQPGSVTPILWFAKELQ
jgi:hypothetical protein